MKKTIVIAMIVLVWALAIFFYFQAKEQQRQSETVNQMMIDIRLQKKRDVETRRALYKEVLEAPASCEGLTTEFIYTTCDNEPDEGWPEWKLYAADAEQACMLDTLHQTNAHAFAIQAKAYDAPEPSNASVANLIFDLCSASLFTDGIDYGDTDKPASKLIKGFYADRATSAVSPGHDY